MFKSFKENLKSWYQRWLQACLALSKATPHLSYLCSRSLCFELGFYEITFGAWVTALFLNLNILNMPPLIKLMSLQFACSEMFLGSESQHEHKQRRKRKKSCFKKQKAPTFRRTDASSGSCRQRPPHWKSKEPFELNVSLLRYSIIKKGCRMSLNAVIFFTVWYLLYTKMWPQCKMCRAACIFLLFVNLNVSRSFRLSHKHYSSDKSKYKSADCIERLPFVIIVLLRGAQGPFYFLSDDWIPASLPRRVVFWCVTTSFVVFQSSWDQFPLFTWLWPRNMTPQVSHSAGAHF